MTPDTLAFIAVPLAIFAVIVAIEIIDRGRQ